jgi:hypothetical protein
LITPHSALKEVIPLGAALFGDVGCISVARAIPGLQSVYIERTIRLAIEPSRHQLVSYFFIFYNVLLLLHISSIFINDTGRGT